MATAMNPRGRDIELQRRPLPPAFVSPSNRGQHEAAGYGDTSTQLWKLYATESEKHDKDLVDSWKSNTDSMLIFTGLFSTIVASFLLQTSTGLLPDTGTQTVILLTQLVAQPNATAVPPSQILTQQTVPPSVIRINILMFLSLFLSVTSALVSTLIQQWAREYLQYSQPSAAPHKRGRVRAYLYDGLTQFQMRRLTYAVPVLLHLSVFLFFFALSDWLYSANAAVGATARYCLVALLTVYLVLSVLPLIVKNAPYQTAFTTPLQACLTLIQVSYLVLLRLVRRSSKSYENQKFSGLFNRIHVGRARALMKEIKKRASKLDRSAMHWLVQKLDDDDMDTFLSSLPGYIDSPLTDTKLVIEGLREDGVPGRIREHFKACVTSVVLSEVESMSRASACINSLRLISETAVNTIVSRPDLKDNDIQGIMEYLEPLCHVSNTSTALHASCIRSLVIREFLIPFAHKDAEEFLTQRFPDYLIPLYRIIRVWKTTGIDQWSHLAVIFPAVGEPPPSDQEMWADILYDGPLINLAILAHAILERAREQDIILDFAWKTFGTLLKALGLGQVRASDQARSRFDEVHLEARAGISRYERGRAPITQLLEAFGIVISGLHISEVFAHPGLPKPKLPQRLIEAIFGRAQLRDSELLETFATHLPGFIEASTPEKAKSFMERLILEDKLWEQLHVDFSRCFQPQIQFPVKLRIVMAFYNIFDVVFMVLKDSSNIDWQSPDFDLLTGHLANFESRVAPGMLIGRVASFHSSIASGQVCHALLAQFSKQRSLERPLITQSLSGLVKVVMILGLGSEEERMYWMSDTGEHDPSTMIKAEALLSVALRDGPLSNFCRLGRLTFEVTLDEASELTLEHLKKAWTMLRIMLDAPHFLVNASPKMWASFDHLRAAVLGAVASEVFRQRLQPLLEMIEEVDRKRPAADIGAERTEDDNQTHAPVSMGQDPRQPGGAPIPGSSRQAEGSRPLTGGHMHADPSPFARGTVPRVRMRPFATRTPRTRVPYNQTGPNPMNAGLPPRRAGPVDAENLANAHILPTVTDTPALPDHLSNHPYPSPLTRSGSHYVPPLGHGSTVPGGWDQEILDVDDS